MAIQRRLKYTAAAGALAIYDVTVGSEDDTPLSSPLSDPTRLHFHTGLVYPATIATYTGTINLGSVSAGGVAEVTTTIAAHGQAGTPYVEGKLLIGSAYVPFAGSVPVVQQSGGASPSQSPSFARFLALGANGTNIVIHEYSVARVDLGYSATSFSYTIYLTNKLVA